MKLYPVGHKALVTTDNWFIAPDGKQYRAVFGTVKGIHTDADVLGIKTNARSTNWYLEIGNMVVAGCQIHYAIQTDTCNHRSVRERAEDKEIEWDCRVYFADGEGA